jgi:hypothetical protein
VTTDESLANGRVLEGSFKRFAPGAEQIHVPTSSRKAALAGIAMVPACRPEVVRAQKIAWRATSLLGPRALPGRVVPWTPPMEDAIWQALTRQWRWEIGDFDAIAVASRAGEAAELRLLLIQNGEPGAMVKLAPSGMTGLAREEVVLRLLTRSRPHRFTIPRLVAGGEVGGWRFLLARPLPARIHRMPSSPPLGRIVGEINIGLSTLPRPTGTPNHWHPMHGELAPWTVRELPNGDLIVLDWENAEWGPPGADEVFYRAAVSALLDASPGPIHVREAMDFWRRKLRDEVRLEHQGPDFNGRMMRALDRMAAESKGVRSR